MEGVQHVPLTQDKAVQLVKDVFISAAERDVYTGDALRICVVTKEGINEQTIPLRKDWGGWRSPFCAFLSGLFFPYSPCWFGRLTSSFWKQECWSSWCFNWGAGIPFFICTLNLHPLTSTLFSCFPQVSPSVSAIITTLDFWSSNLIVDQHSCSEKQGTLFIPLSYTLALFFIMFWEDKYSAVLFTFLINVKNSKIWSCSFHVPFHVPFETQHSHTLRKMTKRRKTIVFF